MLGYAYVTISYKIHYTLFKWSISRNISMIVLQASLTYLWQQEEAGFNAHTKMHTITYMKGAFCIHFLSHILYVLIHKCTLTPCFNALLDSMSSWQYFGSLRYFIKSWGVNIGELGFLKSTEIHKNYYCKYNVWYKIKAFDYYNLFKNILTNLLCIFLDNSKIIQIPKAF